MATCVSCNSTIRWVKTANGNALPLDMAPVADGNVQIVRGVAHVLKALQAPEPGLPRFVSHFATCVNANAHRKGKGSGAAKADMSAAGRPAPDASAAVPRQGKLFE